MHAQDAADALGVAVVAEHHRVAGLQRAGVDAEEDQLADERVGLDLEHQRRERLLVVGVALDGLRRSDVRALDRRHVERRRQVVADGVEHRLDALVLVGGAAETPGRSCTARTPLRSVLRSSSAVNFSSPFR